MDSVAHDFLQMAYNSTDQKSFNKGFEDLLIKNGITKLEIPLRLKKELTTNPKAYPETSQEALRFLTYFPHPMFREAAIFGGFLMVLTPEDKKKIPTPTTRFADQSVGASAEETDAATPPPGARFHWKKEANGPRGFKLLVNPINSSDTAGSCHVDFSAEYVSIDDLFTDPEYRQKGIGKYLLNLAIKEIKKQWPDMECRIVAEPTEPEVDQEYEGLPSPPDAFDLAAFYGSAGFKLMDGESPANGAAVLSIPKAKDLKVISSVDGISPHTEECDIIALDLYDESKCTCGKPPTILEQLVLEADAAEAGASGNYSDEGYEIEVLPAAQFKSKYPNYVKNNPTIFNSFVKPQEIAFALEPVHGEVCAHAAVKQDEEGGPIYPIDTVVEEAHRRKGLASAMYETLEQYLGGVMTESDEQSPDAKKLWKQGDRQFGIESSTHVTAGMLDFPRKQLPAAVWLYDGEPLPRLQPKLRAAILSEARYKLKRFGAKMIGCMLYGGAATYQYHEGGDIDCSVYIDWSTFKGHEDILQEAFKTVEIPWDKYVVHLFVKPKDQAEQIEVADAYYDVLRDEWRLPPLILPKDFDPETYFRPLVEIAEKKAQEFDLMIGAVSREWVRLKKCLRALKEGARDEHVVRERAALTRGVLLDKIDHLCEEFSAVWEARKRLHDELRKKYLNDRDVGRFERFQSPEVTWKYLDEMGYCEFLKMLVKANKSGVIQRLLESATPEVPVDATQQEEQQQSEEIQPSPGNPGEMPGWPDAPV